MTRQSLARPVEKSEATVEKHNKFGARKKTVNGIKFHSIAEADYYLVLLSKQQAGEIASFRLQPRYRLQEGFKKCGKTFRPIDYVADFEVINLDGSKSVIDVKGKETETFSIKRKLFEAKYPDLHLSLVVRERGGWVEK